MPIILLFACKARIIFNFSDNSKFDLRLLWLYPLLKAVVVSEDNTPALSVFLFNKNIYKKALNTKHKYKYRSVDNMKLVKSLKISQVDVQTSYGFRDPAVTGIACGVLGIISHFIDIDSLNQDPGFMTDNNYFNLNAKAKINIGLTLFNLIIAYIRSSRKLLSYQSR